MSDKRSESGAADRQPGAEEDGTGRDERVKKAPEQPDQTPPAKKVGDETPNPLPDDPRENGGDGGGDPGRT
jgi:hypothetical protein